MTDCIACGHNDALFADVPYCEICIERVIEQFVDDIEMARMSGDEAQFRRLIAMTYLDYIKEYAAEHGKKAGD